MGHLLQALHRLTYQISRKQPQRGWRERARILAPGPVAVPAGNSADHRTSSGSLCFKTDQVRSQGKRYGYWRGKATRRALRRSYWVYSPSESSQRGRVSSLKNGTGAASSSWVNNASVVYHLRTSPTETPWVGEHSKKTIFKWKFSIISPFSRLLVHCKVRNPPNNGVPGWLNH